MRLTLHSSRIDYWLVSSSVTSSISKTTIVSAPLTDHAAITLKINTIDAERGPGFWKMNIEVLNSELFENTFKTFWQTWEKSIDKYVDKRQWWEITKIKIKELSIEVAKKLSKERNIKLSQLIKKLDIEKNKSCPNQEIIKALENEHNEMWQNKCNGARIRARIQQYEDGEKSTKFFFSQEKIRSRSKLWHQIKDKNGKIKTGINNILEEQYKFYSELMSSEGWNRESAQKLLGNVDKTITKEELELCEKNITKLELKQAMKALKLGKSPGFDSIPSEFYKKFWREIETCFLQVVEEIEEADELCFTMYRGVICLLFKQGDRDDICNWRPITLLNTDYKLLAIIANNLCF